MRRGRPAWPRTRGARPTAWEPHRALDLYEHLAVGVIACGRDGANLVFNRRARELFEGSGDANADDCAADHGLYTADGDRLLRADEIPLQRALQGEELRDLVVTVRPRRGPPRLVSVSGGPVAGRDRRPFGAVVVVDEVTDRLAMEDELRLRSAIVDHLVEAVIVIKAADGEILYVNETAVRMFGYRSDELVGEPIARLNVPTDQAPAERGAAILDSLEQHGVWSGELEHVRKDRSRFWCDVRVSSFEHAGHGTVWTSVHRDVTARRDS